MSAVSVTVPVQNVAVVTIDRPPVNALDLDTRRSLIETMDELHDRDDIRAIVLTATGHVFCAGADIREKAVLNAGGHSIRAANRITRELFFTLIEGEKPVIAAVGGSALGAGVVLLACCDIVIAAEGTVWAMPEVDVGQGGGASFLQRILPVSLVRRMALTGDRVPVEEILAGGGIARVVREDEVLDAALAVASKIAAKSPTAVRAIRDSFLTVEALEVHDGFRVEQRYIDRLSSSADGAEARRAFLEKRPPRF